MAGAPPNPAGWLLPLGEAGAADAGRTGPKAATLARLRGAGLPIPDGFCVVADAYRAHLSGAGLEPLARRVAHAREREAGRLALEVRLGLLRAPLPASLARGLEAAYQRLCAGVGLPVAVRSSALNEDTAPTSYAGQLGTILGVSNPDDLATAVRSCWASLWTPGAIRYMSTYGVDPARTAVAVLVQRMVPARVAGGALSRTPDNRLVVTAAWGLGPAVGQGEVVPDRYVLRREGPAVELVEPGHKTRQMTGSGSAGPRWQAVPPDLVTAPALGEAEALALARLVMTAERLLGEPLEIEWALDDTGFQLIQARPLAVQRAREEDHPWAHHPGLTGQPAGVGWAMGPARVVRGEAELEHVRHGEVLVTSVPGPALAVVLQRVAGVVTELGGSTSHLAALARERGIPAVLGVRDATRRILQGSLVVVDGHRGVVHPICPDDARGGATREKA